MTDATIIERAKDALASAGLVVDGCLDCSGNIARCGTTDKPNGMDGAYKLFLDDWPRIWLCNWRTGEGGQTINLYDKEELRRLSRSEKAALKERIEAEKAAAKEKLEAARKAAAERAKMFLESLPFADENNAYLKRKGVPALGCVRQTKNGCLVIPVMDETGAITSLQYIAGDGEKRFLKDGNMTGCFFPIPATDKGKDGPLLIAEGYATAASLHLATGLAVLVAYNCGNLKDVALMARAKYPERVIVLCADNDVETKGNPGVSCATKAAQATGGKLAICPAHEGKATDFNDLHLWRSLDAVKAVIDAALKQDDDCPMPDGFFLVREGKRAGLYWMQTKADGDSEEIRLGPPLYVRGRTTDADGNSFGVLLEWQDEFNRWHRWAMPLAELGQVRSEWFATLLDGGWIGNPDAWRKVRNFLFAVKPAKHVRCTDKVGWDDKMACYVLPCQCYGSSEHGEVILQSSHFPDAYKSAGTIEGWRELAALCAGNTRLTFAVCAALAGVLLRPASMEGGGFSFEGGSSSGKTTALQAAASVWGGANHVRSWRLTDNGLEGVAALHNDNVLILDELGQVTGKTLAEACYMIANGLGKTRAGRDGNARRSHAWRVLFLSSGELGLADKLAEAGLKARGGQTVRFVGIPVEKSMLAELHGYPDARALADAIKRLAGEHYGHAGRAFLAGLVKAWPDMDTMRTNLAERLDAATQALLPDEEVSPQVARVARRFALVAHAGGWAQDMGILPRELKTFEAVKACFADWLAVRGGTGDADEKEILAAVRLFIEQHGASRFVDADAEYSQTSWNGVVGFRQRVGSGTEQTTQYCVRRESFKAEVVKGFSPRQAARVLQRAGWLESKGRDLAVKKKDPELGWYWVYAITLPGAK